MIPASPKRARHLEPLPAASERPKVPEPFPDVALVEPPCLIAGEPCRLHIRLARDIACVGSWPQVHVSAGGRRVGTAGGVYMRRDTMSVTIPAVDSCCVSLDITPVGHEHSQSTVNILALPRPAALEVCDLFEMAQRQPDGCYIKASEQLDHVDQKESLKEELWSSYFGAFCADFASVLECLSTGSRCAQPTCACLVRHMLSHHMWHSASFLMTSCIRSGGQVTLGPFALNEEDVEPDRLQANYFRMRGCAVEEWMLVETPGPAGPCRRQNQMVDSYRIVAPIGESATEAGSSEEGGVWTESVTWVEEPLESTSVCIDGRA
eukprot:evm.model.scf_1278.3 EVM.evm.TU.scf_1278.3   scf_1278:21217-23727(-)